LLLLLTLAAIQFTNIVDFMVMMPLGDILQDALEISPSRYGWLVSSYGLAAGLTAFLGVFYLDNLDRKKALLTAYAGFILGTASSAIVPTTDNNELNYWLFVGTRVLTGITGGLLGGLILAIVGDVVPLERRGRAMGIITIAFSLAAILGIPLALTLVDLFDHNWHVPFYGVCLLSLPIWLLAFKAIPAMTSHLKNRPEAYDRLETFRVVFKRPTQRNALLFSTLLILGQFTVVIFLTPYMINNVGLRQEDIKYIYLVGGTCTAASGYLIGRLVDRFGRFRIFTVFAWLSLVVVLIITQLPESGLPVVLVLSGLFFTFASGRMIPANTISTSIVLPKYRAGFMSLNSAAMSISSGLSGVIAGSIVVQHGDHAPLENYDIVGYLAAGATLLALIIVRRLKQLSLIYNDGH